MGLYSQAKKTTRIIFASLAMMATTGQFPTPFSAESATAGLSSKTKSTGPTTSATTASACATATQRSAPAVRAQTDNTHSASGTWNRAPNRTAGLWTHSQVETEKRSTIQFASASGMDEGVTSAVAETTSQATNKAEANKAEAVAENLTAPAAETKATSEETSAPARTSASVKEQLLNALRLQREAIANPNALRPTTSPGSLTIMNSPKLAPNSTDESNKLVTPQSAMSSSPPPTPELPTSSNEADVSKADQNPAMQPTSAKSYAGLTRTLEEDLKSDDAFLRERAQRFLRLQMQLLKLRSRQAAAAETTTQMSAHGTGDHSTQVQHGGLEESTHPKAPTHDVTSGSHDEHVHSSALAHQPSDEITSRQVAQSPEDLPPVQTTLHGDHVVHDNTSEESSHAALEPTANASLLGKVVVNGPIDRLGLANNLFAVGEYALALEMYEQTKGPELSAQQQFWVEYQFANCLRRVGNPAEASNRYRKLASQPEAGWLSQQARWWVETLESIRILEKALKDHSVEQSQKVIENAEATVVTPPAENAATSTVSESIESQEPAKDEHSH